MKPYDFDQVINRRGFGSVKWDLYGSDVLPLWVADMDFPVFDEIQRALQERISHPFFGYHKTDPDIYDVICDWLQRYHGWKVNQEDILLLPGVVSGFNWVASALCTANSGIAFHTPVYFPFYDVGKNHNIPQKEIPLIYTRNGYEIDFDLFEEKIRDGISVFLLCNPHNPVGRVFRKEELERIGEICLKHHVRICSDEIHSDIVFSGSKHIPIASLSPELAKSVVTLMAPSKTFNIPGLQFSFAICENKELRQELESARKGLLEHPTVLAEVATKAAYQYGGRWLTELLRYLEGNRDFLSDFLSKNIPEIKTNKPEGTYLAWLDCESLELQQSSYTFFLEKAGVALNDGKRFGNMAPQFVRLNFACPYSMLSEALEKMVDALNKHR